MPHSPTPRRRFALFIALLAFLLVAAAGGCAEEEETSSEAPVRWDTFGKESTDPVVLSKENKGFGYFAGDILASAGADLAATFDVAVFRSQLIDELMVSREGIGSIPQALFSARAATLQNELEGQQPFARGVYVLDLMRWADGSQAGGPVPYLTTWDENDRAIANYGFWRDEYRDTVLDEVADAAALQPEYFVVGAEMERLLALPGGMDDYANFVSFYREAYTRIKAVSPSTKVSAGVDWVRLQLDVVPTMTIATALLPADLRDDTVEEIACNALPSGDDAQRYARACTDAAFARFVEPLLHVPNPEFDPENALSEETIRTADFLALSATPGGTDFGNDAQACPEDFFGYLRNWSVDWPVVYYQVNWQVTSESNELKAKQWLETLLARNAGVNIELLAWALARDLTTSDCGKLTTDLGAPDWVCFQGLLSVSNRGKEVFGVLQE